LVAFNLRVLLSLIENSLHHGLHPVSAVCVHAELDLIYLLQFSRVLFSVSVRFYELCVILHGMS